MSNRYEVISAFLDDERFDASELAAALSQPDGRDMLIDLVALRHIVQPETKDGTTAVLSSRRPMTWRPTLAAAAVVVALFGGYFAGQRRTAVDSLEPPSATRVVEVAGAWQDVPPGGVR